MSLEQYVDFKALSFGPGNLRDLRYSVRGSEKEHVQHTDERGTRSSRYDKITPDGNALQIWKDVLNNEQLELPTRCDVCPENRQTFLWRTFTPQALQGFRENEGRSTQFTLPPSQPLDGYDAYICSTEDVNQPGVLWMARDPDLALSVGLARALLENKPITLLGVTLCQEDMEAGVKAYATRAARESTVLREIKPNQITQRYMSGGGEIVNSISAKRIQEGVAYTVDHNFFAPLKEALGEREPTDRALKEVSTTIGDLILDLTFVDPEVVNELDLNTLPRVWKPFLTRMRVETFLWS